MECYNSIENLILTNKYLKYFLLHLINEIIYTIIRNRIIYHIEIEFKRRITL